MGSLCQPDSRASTLKHCYQFKGLCNFLRRPSPCPRKEFRIGQDMTRPERTLSNLIMHAVSATLQPTERPTAIPHLDGKVKFVGLGAKGATVLRQLMQSEKLDREHVWYIDTEDKGLGPANVSNKIFLRANEGNETIIPPSDLHKLVGAGAYDQQGKGNINSGDGGIAFIIASAESAPGSTQVLLSLVQSLRAAGFFTAVALSTPFQFEGTRKVQIADELVRDVRDRAHLVSVIRQEALIDVKTPGSSSAVTVDDAVSISNNAMEHTIRCILAAIHAPEVLDSSKGALIWHGSEMRRFRRLLSPPLQHLLTRPSSSTLGRGAASMTHELARSMGSCQALMHLATDAVQAAVESPFLEDVRAQATGALCCVSLPPGFHTIEPGKQASHGTDHATARLAVQAAAGALMQMSNCTEIVMLYHTLTEERTDHEIEARPTKLGLEVSLLMLLPEELDHANTSQQDSARLKADQQPSAEIKGNTGRKPATGSAHYKGDLPKLDKAQTKGRLPSSSWHLISAMAGGSANAKQSKIPSQLKVDKHELRRAGSQSLVKEVITVSAEASKQESLSVGDQLAETFVAQSLDLPPKAAKWRQQQRARQERPKLMVRAPEAAWQSEEETDEGLTSKLRALLGGPQQVVDVRERTFAILERDRGDAWESEGFQ